MAEDQHCAFQQSPPHSARESCPSPPASPLDFHDDDLRLPSDHTRRTSAHSSISSFPVSVSQCIDYGPLGPPRPPYSQHSTEGFVRNVSPRVDRVIGSVFRHPSSVEEMQMKDDDSESLLINSRRKGSRISTRSHGRILSPLSSASKRQSYSSQTTPLKGSKLRKEFPLVLLHCSLLPPASSSMPSNYDSELYAALLPDEYRARWNTLQDKLADPEMKSRGLLIPHPQDDYELLEERLLESLGLEVPRIQGNHFFHDDGSTGDSGFESGSQVGDESSDEAPNGRCPDCGTCLHQLPEDNRKWEIRVYAANGLMRAGAWAAAWRDMERVDVEISLAMPDDVRREINSRLEVLRSVQESEGRPSAHEDPSQLEFQQENSDCARHEASANNDRPYENIIPSTPDRNGPPSLLRRKWQLTDFFCDGKNILITLLGILVLFYTIRGPAPGIPFAGSPRIVTSTAWEIEPATITTTSYLNSIGVTCTAPEPELSMITATSDFSSVGLVSSIPESDRSIVTSTADLSRTMVASTAQETDSSIIATASHLSRIGFQTDGNPALDMLEILPSNAAPIEDGERGKTAILDPLSEPAIMQEVLSHELQCEIRAPMAMEEEECPLILMIS